MSKSRLLRTFLAVELPQRVKNITLSLQTTVEAQPRVVKWVKLYNIHLTLKFIGETPEDSVKKINESLAEVVKLHRDFSLTIAGTGVFPKKERPRILWLGVKGEVDSLTTLVRDINAGLDPLGYPSETRDFSPHVTIGRIRYPQKITPDVTAFLNSEYEPITFTIRKVTLFQSDLVPGGPIYSILGVHQLTPR